MASSSDSFDIIIERHREATQLRDQEDLELAQFAQQGRARLEEARLRLTELAKVEKKIKHAKEAGAASLRELRAKHAEELRDIEERHKREVAANMTEANGKVFELSIQAQAVELAYDAEYEEIIFEKELREREESLQSKRKQEDEDFKDSLFEALQVRSNPKKAAVSSTPIEPQSVLPSTHYFYELRPATPSTMPALRELPRMTQESQQQTIQRGNTELGPNYSSDSDTPLIDLMRRRDTSGGMGAISAKKQKTAEIPKEIMANRSSGGTPASTPSFTAQSRLGDDTIIVLPRTRPESPPTFPLQAIRCLTAAGVRSGWWSADEDKIQLRLHNHCFRPYTEMGVWMDNHREWEIIPHRVQKMSYNPLNLVIHIIRGATKFGGKDIWVRFADKAALDGFLACYASRWPRNSREEEYVGRFRTWVRS